MWPKAPNILSRRLNEIVTNLREVGIIIERPIDTTTNTTLIEIRKVSPEYLESPESDNQAENESKNTGDTAGDTNTVARQVSPEENSQNQAENQHPEDTGDILYVLDNLLLQIDKAFLCQSNSIHRELLHTKEIHPPLQHRRDDQDRCYIFMEISLYRFITFT